MIQAFQYALGIQIWKWGLHDSIDSHFLRVHFFFKVEKSKFGTSGKISSFEIGIGMKANNILRADLPSE